MFLWTRFNHDAVQFRSAMSIGRRGFIGGIISAIAGGDAIVRLANPGEPETAINWRSRAVPAANWTAVCAERRAVLSGDDWAEWNPARIPRVGARLVADVEQGSPDDVQLRRVSASQPRLG